MSTLNIFEQFNRERSRMRIKEMDYAEWCEASPGKFFTEVSYAEKLFNIIKRFPDTNWHSYPNYDYDQLHDLIDMIKVMEMGIHSKPEGEWAYFTLRMYKRLIDESKVFYVQPTAEVQQAIEDYFDEKGPFSLFLSHVTSDHAAVYARRDGSTSGMMFLAVIEARSLYSLLDKLYRQ